MYPPAGEARPGEMGEPDRLGSLEEEERPRVPVVVMRGLRRPEEEEEREREGAGVSAGVHGLPSASARSLSRYCAAKWVLY